MLDGIERFGNKMPNPAVLFLLLCVFIIVLSQVLFWSGVQATSDPTIAAASAILIGLAIFTFASAAAAQSLAKRRAA